MPVDASTPIAAVAANVAGALRKAAQTTGASFDYLLATAKIESDLNPNLTMRSSSATGLFQFIEQTWLATLKQAGRAVGYSQYASAITQTSSGRYVVPDPSLRNEIMKLRKDPTANAVMAGVFTQSNAAVLGNRIGRKPSEGELYIAHFFGPSAAAKLINLARANPQASAAALFPHAARANRTIFFDKQGYARSAAGVYGELVHRYQVARLGSPANVVASAYAAAPAPPAPAPPVSDTAGVTQVLAMANETSAPASPAPTYHSLFQDGNLRGAVSPIVAELWSTPSRTNSEGAPAAAPARDPAPLDLFQELPPNGRALFGGSA